MPCLACANRLLHVFTQGTTIAPLFSAAVSVSQRLRWSRRIPRPVALNKYTTSARTASASTREGKHQKNRIPAQRHRYIGLAYSQKRLSDDDYMPFITETLPPPPLGWPSVMSRIPPRATEAVNNGMLEIPENSAESKDKNEFRARWNVEASRSAKHVKGVSNRATFIQAVAGLDGETSLGEKKEDQGLSTVRIKHNNEDGASVRTTLTTDNQPAILYKQLDTVDTYEVAEGGSGTLVRQILQKMEQVELEVASLPADMPVRGTLTPSTTPRTKWAEGSHFQPMPTKSARTRAQYRNIWNLTPLLQSNNSLHKSCDQPFILKSVKGPNHTINSILQSTNKHSHWLVQKAALAKKLNNNPWRTHTRVSPGTTQLIKEINAVVPYTLKASDIARKFRISIETARRILRCKWMPTDAEKERRARQWFERGEKIRVMQMEQGCILTKEQRQEAWKKKERRRQIKEMNLKFGLLGTETGDRDEVQRSLGRIKWEGKIL